MSLAVEVYKQVLDGTRLRFPNGFWDRPENVQVISKYFIEEVLEFNLEDIKGKLSKQLFVEYKLSGLLQNVFKNSISEFVKEVYPNVIKPWEIKSVPNNYWNEETAQEAIRHLILEKLKWIREDIVHKFEWSIITTHGLHSPTGTYIGYRPYDVVSKVFPEMNIKPWELSHTPKDFWNDSTAKEAIRWFFLEKMPMSRDEMLQNVSVELFFQNGLWEPYRILKGLVLSMIKSFPELNFTEEEFVVRRKQEQSLRMSGFSHTEEALLKTSGENNYNVVLNIEDVREIVELYGTGMWTHRQLARKFKVSKTRVGQILRGEAWKLRDKF